MKNLKESVIAMGEDIRSRIVTAERRDETNKEWGTFLKQQVRDSLNKHMQIVAESSDVNIHVIDMPYTAETGSGRGEGKNLIVIDKTFFAPGSDKNIYCLIDEIDGTWNATCGLAFSCSTMLAFTSITKTKPEDLTLAHFPYGFIIPYYGSGIYLSELHHPPQIALWNGTSLPLHMSPVVSPSQTRFILDLFTEEEASSLALSIPAVNPVMQEWGDLGRFYGAGLEISMLFGYRNMTPGFSAYVAAHQKMDNIVPTYALVLGAGGIVTDWWGNSIMGKKLPDRVHVIMAANEQLHENLVKYLSKRPQP